MLVGVDEPLVKGDGTTLVLVHLVKVPLASCNALGVILEHGLSGRGQAEAARSDDGMLHHLVKLQMINSSIPGTQSCQLSIFSFC